MFTILSQKCVILIVCLILFQTHLCDHLQMLNTYFLLLYVHVSIRLRIVTYMTTTMYLKKSYVYVEIENINKFMVKNCYAKSFKFLW